MIVDKIEHLHLYEAVVPEFKQIAEFLANNDVASFEEGSYQVCPGVKINISEYEPYAAGDKWEAHKRYADLQIVVAGDECMDGAALCDCAGPGEYFEEDDYMFYDKCEGSIATVKATAGTFAYFAPTDPHRPGIRYQADKVKKAVFKIPV